MMTPNYYDILGVTESADAAELKKVYRRLAKKYHPDRNKGDKEAEAKFKEITAAYDTLSNNKKRQEYDMLRKYGPLGGSGASGFPGQGGGPFGGGTPFNGDFSQFASGQGRGFNFESTGAGGIEEILASLFGGAAGGQFSNVGGRPRSAPPRRGPDAHLTLTVSFMEAIDGTRRVIKASDGRKITVKVPSGIDHGGRIRLRGQGQPGLHSGEKGNLIITVHVMSDKQFERQGNNIHSAIDITFVEAIKGCKQPVKTLTRTVSVSIPPGTQPGTRMRLKGLGLAIGSEQGDHYVTVNVTIPTTLTDKQRQMIDDWEG